MSAFAWPPVIGNSVVAVASFAVASFAFMAPHPHLAVAKPPRLLS
jgi:hypothetical protein